MFRFMPQSYLLLRNKTFSFVTDALCCVSFGKKRRKNTEGIEYFLYICSMIIKKLLIVLLAILCVSSTANAEVRLPQLFQSGMVMQRGKPIPVWGWADKGELVTVTFQKKTYTTTADDQGCWRIDLPKMKAGGPFTLEVNSEGVNSEKLIIDNILIGDVWLLSGQSNIDVTIERVYPQYVNEIDQFNNDQIRLFRVQNETSVHGVKDDIRPTNINWKPLTKQNAWLFSAVGSFLGKQVCC